MNNLNRNFRAVISFALALSVASIATLSSLAASNASGPAPGEDHDNRPRIGVLSAPAGWLTGTGHFTIDGDEARPGATVLSGSTIATGSDGNVVIDLGSLGHIVLRPETRVRLTLFKKRVHVSLDRVGSIIQSVPPGVIGQLTVEAGNAQLGISRGVAEVKCMRTARTLQAGEVMALDHLSEVITKGDTLLTAEGEARSATNESPTADNSKMASDKTQAHTSSQGSIVSAGLVGVIALAGTATAITLGVIAGRNHSNSLIPPRPSRIIP
jgi:hypothetical protein